MIDCGSLEYAHARVHARHGQRLDETAWQRIESMREFAALLEFARGTSLQPWLVVIGTDSSAHHIEATLRDHARQLVGEVMTWMPAPWRAALAWCAVLPDLAPLQHLARGGEPAQWMRSDQVLRECSAAQPAQRSALVATGPLAALAPAWAAPHALGPAWLAEWQRRLPEPMGDADQPLAQLVHALLDHRKAFAEAMPGQGWPLRSALRARLSMLLRGAALEPAAAFIHLALCALDLERLRAALLRLALFARSKVQ